jgi:NADPH-dependent glutamate synthase beta subunit-like oxidoreductase
VNNGALIIGSSLAGIQAAQDIADAGVDVHLIESAPFLGNAGAATIPHHLFTTRILELAKHPRVSLWTNTDLSQTEERLGGFDVQLRQHPRYVDLQRCTGCGECIEACPVTVPSTGNKAIFFPKGAQPECAVIEKFGKAPCSSACPGGIHVQGYVALIAQGRFQEAFDLICEAIPFPGICGRICTHPCELNCRRTEIDAAVAIRQLKRFVTDWIVQHDEIHPSKVTNPQVPVTNGRRVAVVGAGPAGMTVAERLVRLGYRLTVFEKMPVLAGMLAAGIPAYRLPREVIDREYKRIQKKGVNIRLGTEIGPNGQYTLDDLFRTGYDAICLAIGAHQSLKLRIPGENLPGVVKGIQLLKIINFSQQRDDPSCKAKLHQILRKGSKTRVAILGGGNTAFDVARSLKRLGISDVWIIYRRSCTEMPALPEELAETENEDVPIQFLTAPVRIFGDRQAGVSGLECIRMTLGTQDATGRRRPVPVAGSEFKMDVDLVVVSIGQVPDLGLLEDDYGIVVTKDGRIQVDGSTFATDRDGVFAVGDAVTSDHMSAIEAIGMGKKAAAAIDAYLNGFASEPRMSTTDEMPVARRDLTPDERSPKPRIPMPVLPVSKRLKDFAEVELGYSETQAITEAQRCLACGPCSECMACIQACKAQAIVHEQRENIIDLDIGAIIVAEDLQKYSHEQLPEGRGIYRVAPEEPLRGSAAAARVLASLPIERPINVPTYAVGADPRDPVRIGVFICQCGGAIAKVVDTGVLTRCSATLPGVIRADIIDQACLPEAAELIRRRVTTDDINRVMLAACACCSLDQVCFSCAYQRVRCKQSLGLFTHESKNLPTLESSHLAENLAHVVFEFVNIREHCAWAHADDPKGATAKASALAASAIMKLGLWSYRPTQTLGIERSVLIMGGSPAASICQRLLNKQEVVTAYAQRPPSRFWRADGHFMAADNSRHWRAAAVVMAPVDSAEAERLCHTFKIASKHIPLRTDPIGVETHLPGVFFCDPAMDSRTVGAAAAAKVAAWLGPLARRPGMITAVADANRCRACKTCIEVCEYGAPQLVGEESNRHCWIDPIMCAGCGTCAAHCPSSAITAGYSTDEQLDAMIETALNDGDRLNEKR